jgi:hypothetical protein
VLPEWLEREIGETLHYFRHPVVGDTATGFSIEDSDDFRGTSGTRVEGRVCKACNNGWLSSLEIAARPIVAGLVAGTSGLDALSDSDRSLLATWLYKVLLVAVSSDLGEYEIPQKDYHTFHSTQLPGTWINLYGSVLPTTCNGFCGPAQLKWTRPKAANEKCQACLAEDDSAVRGLKWVYHIGCLHVLAAYTTMSCASQTVVEGLHKPLWISQPYLTARGHLHPRLAADSAQQWLAFGLVPYLMVDIDSHADPGDSA